MKKKNKIPAGGLIYKGVVDYSIVKDEPKKKSKEEKKDGQK